MSDNLLIMTLVKKANLQQVSFAGTVETTVTEPAGVDFYPCGHAPPWKPSVLSLSQCLVSACRNKLHY